MAEMLREIVEEHAALLPESTLLNRCLNFLNTRAGRSLVTAAYGRAGCQFGCGALLPRELEDSLLPPTQSPLQQSAATTSAGALASPTSSSVSAMELDSPPPPPSSSHPSS
jgi:hypothetical protein